MRRSIVTLALGVALAAASGCRVYTLEGRVIEGSFTSIEAVTAGDERLEGPGLDGVRVSIERDPDRLARRVVATRTTGPDGRFEIPLDEFGAGWMDERWGVRAQRSGYRTAETMIRLPDDKALLLITLTPGSADTNREDDLWDQYERFR